MRCSLSSRRVLLGLNIKNGKYYAVKLPNSDSDLQYNTRIIFNEARILQQMDHPNILKCHHFSQTGLQTERVGGFYQK